MFFKFEIEADTREWILEQFHWAIEDGLLSRDCELVLPTAQFFPTQRGSPNDTVAGLVDNIKGHLNIEDARIDVAPADVLPEEFRHEYQSTSSIAGTWQSDGDGAALIRYDPAMLSKKLGLLSVLVHEVMHHRLHIAVTPPEMDEATHELATDLHCITAGFGVLSMSGAEQVGWQGYMRQETRAFSLAVFCLLLDCKDIAIEYLPARSRKLLKRALKYCDQMKEDIQKLKHELQVPPTHSV